MDESLARFGFLAGERAGELAQTFMPDKLTIKMPEQEYFIEPPTKTGEYIQPEIKKPLYLERLMDMWKNPIAPGQEEWRGDQSARDLWEKMDDELFDVWYKRRTPELEALGDRWMQRSMQVGDELADVGAFDHTSWYEAMPYYMDPKDRRYTPERHQAANDRMYKLAQEWTSDPDYPKLLKAIREDSRWKWQ